MLDEEIMQLRRQNEELTNQLADGLRILEEAEHKLEELRNENRKKLNELKAAYS